MKNIELLISEIKKRAEEILGSESDLPEMEAILADAIRTALKEISMGANPDELQARAVIKLLEDAYEAGYATREIRAFVLALRPSS